MYGLDYLNQLLLALPGLLMALVFHEYAHARMAYAFGDPTPRLQGRLTLDPRAHLDWLGVLVLVMSGFRFGWAKPVQVNVYKLRPRFWGELLVSLAGILMNLALAICFAVLSGVSDAGLLGFHNRQLSTALELAGFINLWLAIFNFLPVPPLDGWRFFRRLIPGFAGSRVALWLDQFGMFFLMLLVILPMGRQILGLMLTPLIWLLGGLVSGASGLFLGLLL